MPSYLESEHEPAACCGALAPPVGGTFHFEILFMAPLTKTCPKMVLSHKGGSLCVKTFLQKKFLVPGEIPLSALAPARRAAAASEPKAPPCPLTVRAHHGARPCWRKSTCAVRAAKETATTASTSRFAPVTLPAKAS